VEETNKIIKGGEKMVRNPEGALLKVLEGILSELKKMNDTLQKIYAKS